MALLRACTRKRLTFKGFTLIEMLVVIGLFTLLGSLGLFLSMDDYRSYSFRSDRDLLISVLEKARSQSINNVCIGISGACIDGKPHGVHLMQSAGQPMSFVIFQGPSYATRDTSADEVVSARGAALTAVAPSFTDVVFSQLAATTTLSPSGVQVLTLSDGQGKFSTIDIGSEGRISWSN